MVDTAFNAPVNATYVEDVLSALVGISSPTGSEEECARFMVAEFDKLGMRSDLQGIAPGRFNAVGRRRGTGGGRDLLITGHMDTSYSGAEPGLEGEGFQPHAVLEDGHLIGLGAWNMKCGLAAALGASHALLNAGLELRGDLILAGVAGEIEKISVEEHQGPEFEGYGLGTRHMVAHGVTADAAVVGEPTDFRVSLGHIGAIWMRLTIFGDFVHTARSAVAGVTHAVFEAQEIVGRLQEWIADYQSRTDYLGTTCPATIGSIRAGHPWRASRTPMEYNIYLDVRYPPGVAAMDVKGEIRELLEDIAADKPALRWDLESYMVAAPARISADEPIVQVAREATSKVLGTETAMYGRGPMDDAGHLMDAGIPAICLGVPAPDPEFAKAHPGESVRIDDVVKLSQIYVNVASQFCNGDPINPKGIAR